MNITIYKHENKSNGKCYIGQTILKLNDRWQNGKGKRKSAGHYYWKYID